MTEPGVTEPGEADLVRAALAGDADALERVVRIVQDAVYRLALRMTGLPADAEDATQEILIKVVTRLSSWRGEASLTTWAYRIAVNYLLNQRRRTAMERRELTFDELGAELVEGLADYSGPDAELLAEEVRLRCTQAMLQCLERSERLVYVLGEVFELPSDQAGWILDTTPAAYRKRLERVRRQLRAFVHGNCGLVNPDAACHCSRRITAAKARGRLDPRGRGLVGHPTTDGVPWAARQMHQLHDAAGVLRRHPDYAAPRTRTEAVLTLLRSGRFPLVERATPP